MVQGFTVYTWNFWKLCEILLKIVWYSLKRYEKFSLKSHKILFKIVYNSLENYSKFS